MSTPLDSIRTRLDEMFSEYAEAAERRYEEKAAEVVMLSEALAAETPECAFCAEPLPSERAIEALRRLMAKERGIPVEQVSLEGNSKHWLAGFCDSTCISRGAERAEAKEEGRRFLGLRALVSIDGGGR